MWNDNFNKDFVAFSRRSLRAGVRVAPKRHPKTQNAAIFFLAK
jgi:hypothetical protein